jgi:serine/threonine protein kinase
VNPTQRYRLVRTIASGGMAQVLEAVAQGMEGFERRVAIKRLLPQHLRDGGRRRMFFDEASIGSRLHHGGVVQIFDYGIIDSAAFLAMEFVDGMDSLRAVSLAGEEGTMPEAIALHVISEVAHALAYIHDVKDELGKPLGIVHRDVSPQNILLSWDGDVKLSDFGIALSLQREESTAEGVVKGKLPYMPPEQALGMRVDSTADVYALGATLATLLGGRAIGPAMTDDEASSRVTAARLRGVSAAVAELIGACTCRDPSARLRAADVAAVAGSLATQRLSHCARGSLRDWLAPLRAREREGSALDDLMGLCLVPVGQDGGRTFTVSQMIPLREPREARTSAPFEMLVPPPPTTTRAMKAARWAATAGLVAAAVVFIAGRPRAPESAPAMRSAAGDVAGTAASAPRPALPSALPADLQRATTKPASSPLAFTSSSSSSSSVSSLAGGSQATRHARHPFSGNDRGMLLASTRESSARAAVPARESSSRGWVRVGGRELLGGQVTLDGVAIGFAPLERELPAGPHAIAVISPESGQILVRRSVNVGSYHTRVRPLSLLR